MDVVFGGRVYDMMIVMMNMVCMMRKRRSCLFSFFPLFGIHSTNSFADNENTGELD